MSQPTIDPGQAQPSKPLATPLPWHAIGFALFPLLAIYATNAVETPLQMLARPVAVVLILLLVLWIGFWLILRSSAWAARAATLAVAVFWLYQPVYHLTQALLSESILLRNRYFLPAYAASGLFLFWYAIGRRSGQAPSLAKTRCLNAIGLALLVVPLAVAAMAKISQRSSDTTMAMSPAVSLTAPKDRPDIFWIILDAYGRTDVLKNAHYRVESTLGETLPDLGFFVADRSQSNYCTTPHSLSSTLNLAYHDLLWDGVEPENVDERGLNHLMTHSVVRRSLAPHGYRFVICSNGLSRTWVPTEANLVIDADVVEMNEFEMLVLDTTILAAVLPRLLDPYAVHRRRIEHTLQSLPELAADGTPDFVLAHVIAPHHPFVYRADGRPVEKEKTRFGFRLPYSVESEEYALGYRQQVLHINRLVERTVRDIIKASATQPVIIIQGDHGPGDANVTPATTRFPILNAYYLPGDGSNGLYPTITPVNTFRIVFNQYFGADLDLLPDRSWWSSYRQLGRWVSMETAEVNPIGESESGL